MCTRVFWNDNGVAMVTGRTFDWEVSDATRLWVTPRGTARVGDAGPDSLAWHARYGSVALQSWGVVTPEALNERGLAVHTLYLGAAGWEQPDDRPVVSNRFWSQYVADNFATVAEALEGLERVRIASVPLHGQHVGAHLAIEDPSGDAAIVEIVDGRATVRRGAEYRVMTNDPPYEQQVANRARYRGFGGELPLPGDIPSEERFVRASYFLSHLPTPVDHSDAIAGVMSVVRNCSVPYGAPDTRFDTFPTWWATAIDLTDRVLYFTSTRAPNVVWLSLDAVDLSEGSGTRALDPAAPALAGEIAGALAPAALDWGVAETPAATA
jgi:choloylglycine hydrolase